MKNKKRRKTWLSMLIVLPTDSLRTTTFLFFTFYLFIFMACASQQQLSFSADSMVLDAAISETASHFIRGEGLIPPLL